MRPRITTLLVVVAAATLGPPAVAQAAGELTQKPGTAGCISEDTAKGECRDGKALQYPQSVAVSPDGRNVYIAAVASDGVGILDRDRTTGALTQRTDLTACITKDGSGNTCREAKSLAGADDVAVSPDGRNVYVTSEVGVTILDRDPGNGALEQKDDKDGCVSWDGTGDTCEKGTAIKGASSVVVSPDGTTVYVAAAASGAVAIFNRDSAGKLEQKPGKAGCIAEVGGEACQDGRALAGPSRIAVSPDGQNVYAATVGNLEEAVASAAGSLAILKRDPATGGLAQEPGPAGCVSHDGSDGTCQSSGIKVFYDVTVSPDGRSVYVSSVIDGAIARFDRDAASGALTQKPGIALGGAASEVVVSPDGRNAYAALPQSGTVATLDRDATGALTPRTGAAGCVSDTGSAGGCQDGRGLAAVWVVAVSPDGHNVYSGATQSSAVAIFDRAQPTPPATPPQADRLAPTVSRFSLSPKRLRAGARARLRFSLSEPADVRIVIERTRPGKRRVVRTLSLRGRAGVNTARVRLRGRGRYRATITATDAAGNRSATRRAGFQLVRRPAR